MIIRSAPVSYVLILDLQFRTITAKTTLKMLQ